MIDVRRSLRRTAGRSTRATGTRSTSGWPPEVGISRLRFGTLTRKIPRWRTRKTFRSSTASTRSPSWGGFAGVRTKCTTSRAAPWSWTITFTSGTSVGRLFRTPRSTNTPT
uniref:(northern house mosquito) hypothetical protein n=1 Tax=Culex pipiens TaxID=7175 RepID=A0A8D8E4N4_CULPI